ncbi:Uncharacterised protein [Mycobacterium tuberculosis]|uniref:Uncharacterized protein n=1 Tax=Mycobacterium tuberculosis TaxID=1773 RepID=A0A654T7X8_MYCTX|nr:Uncharacterised protein [Mycobacterium tuberculosis]
MRIGRKHARHVERDIPVADDHHAFVTEIDWQIVEVGMSVEPRDQLRGGTGARQSHPVNRQPAVVGRSDRVQHGVMVGQ